MDLHAVIRELIEERKRIDRTIAALEAMDVRRTESPVALRSRRGRKGMSAQERREVSARMRKYWAKRRAQSHS